MFINAIVHHPWVTGLLTCVKLVDKFSNDLNITHIAINLIWHQSGPQGDSLGQVLGVCIWGWVLRAGSREVCLKIIENTYRGNKIIQGIQAITCNLPSH